MLSTLLKVELGFIFQFADPRLLLGRALALEGRRKEREELYFKHKHTDQISH